MFYASERINNSSRAIITFSYKKYSFASRNTAVIILIIIIIYTRINYKSIYIWVCVCEYGFGSADEYANVGIACIVCMCDTFYVTSAAAPVFEKSFLPFYFHHCSLYRVLWSWWKWNKYTRWNNKIAII